MVEPPLGADDVASTLRAAMRAGGQWAEVYAERRDSETVRLDGGAVEEIRTDRDLGAGVRVIKDGRAGYAYTNVLTAASLAEAAQAAATASGSAASIADTPRIDLRDRSPDPVQRAARPATQADPVEKARLLRRIDAAARGRSDCVRHVTVVHVDVTQAVLIATTDGNLVCDQRVRTRVTCRVSAVRGGRLETGFDGPGVGAGMELYDERSPEGIGADSADRALRALEAGESPGGVMPVVLGSAGGGLLLHEACGHGLEGDSLARGSSIYATRFGEPVASSLVTAIDEPSMALGYGSYAVDDEGAIAGRTLLLDAGVQVGALTDRVNADLLSGISSANARRESYAHPPLTRMSNTYIAQGAHSPEAILADVARGVYVTRLKGGDVDVATGEFAFTASEAYLIENGQLARPLAEVSLLGNGPAALSAVDAVGDDLAFTQALCGKDGQWIPVSYGSPTLLISKLTVSGSGDG